MPTDQILKMMNKNKECVQILFTHTHGNPKNIWGLSKIFEKSIWIISTLHSNLNEV